MLQAKISLRSYSRKNNKKVETANIIFPQKIMLLSHNCYDGQYILYIKKALVNLTDLTHPKSAPDSIWWSPVSKAFCKSTKTPQAIFPSSRAFLIFPVIRWGTHLFMSLFLSVRLSVCPFVCPSVVQHVSGTVHYLIIIFGTLM